MSSKKFAITKKKLTPLGERIDVLLVKEILSATEFAEKVGVKDAYLSKLRRKMGAGGDKFWRGIRRQYPAWEGFLRGETETPPDILKPPVKPYQQESERMLPRINNIMPDSGPGQMRLPADLGAFQVVRTVESEEGQKQDLEQFKTRLHQALEHILKRGDKALVTAIQTNLEQFSRLVKTEERLRALEEQVNILLGKHKKTAMER